MNAMYKPLIIGGVILGLLGAGFRFGEEERSERFAAAIQREHAMWELRNQALEVENDRIEINIARTKLHIAVMDGERARRAGNDGPTGEELYTQVKLKAAEAKLVDAETKLHNMRLSNDIVDSLERIIDASK